MTILLLAENAIIAALAVVLTIAAYDRYIDWREDRLWGDYVDEWTTRHGDHDEGECDD